MMTAKQLRERLAEVPDDMEVLIESYELVGEPTADQRERDDLDAHEVTGAYVTHWPESNETFMIECARNVSNIPSAPTDGNQGPSEHGNARP